jgi:hypothetical protein
MVDIFSFDELTFVWWIFLALMTYDICMVDIFSFDDL